MKNDKFEDKLNHILTSSTPDVLQKIKADPRFVVAPKKASWIKDLLTNRRVSYAFSSIFVIALLLFGVFFFQGTNQVEVIASTVTIDINPSIELQLNEDDEVIDILAINEDATSLIKDHKIFQGMSLDTAIQTLVQHAINEGYVLDENNSFLINVSAKDEAKKALLQEKLEIAFSRESARHNRPFDVRSMQIEAPNIDVEEAKERRMSVAKYELIQTILQASDAYTMEDLANASIRTLFDILSSLNIEDNNFPPMGPNNTPGNNR